MGGPSSAEGRTGHRDAEQPAAADPRACSEGAARHPGR
jgi:hypothetical protein